MSQSDGNVTEVFCGPKGLAELAQDEKGASKHTHTILPQRHTHLPSAQTHTPHRHIL